MFVAVEGMDGVGKTTISKILAKDMKMEYIEKPMQKFLNISDDEYDKLLRKIWSSSNPNITPWFFSLGNIVTRDFNKNVVVDRHILSTYFWDYNGKNKSIFDAMLDNNNVIPDITLILYSDSKIRVERIKKRDQNDEDLKSSKLLELGYDKMLRFADEIKMPYVVVDTEQRTIEEVSQKCEEILYITKKAIKLGKPVSVICNYYNNEFLMNKKIKATDRLPKIGNTVKVNSVASDLEEDR